MVALGWAAVLTGAYVIYPWYRAVPPAGLTDLALYPRYLLKSSATTAGWHDLGMEWKEYVAWMAPIAMTMVAYILTKYRLSIQGSSTSPHCRSGLCLSGVWSGGGRRVLWCNAQQIRARKRWSHNPFDGEKANESFAAQRAERITIPEDSRLPNGPAAAAILSAGVGCAGIGHTCGGRGCLQAYRQRVDILSAHRPALRREFRGHSAVARGVVHPGRRWRAKTVAIAKVNATAFLLLVLGILLTFPPFADLLQGK